MKLKCVKDFSGEKKREWKLKMKKISNIIVLITLAVSIIILGGCSKGQDSSSNVAGSKIIVTDMKGREISLAKPATRVVAITAADCEILYALGAGDTLVGRGEYCNYPEAVSEVIAVESGAETNIEQIIALEPQIVFMNTMAQDVETVEALDNAGIQVAVSVASDIEGVYETIALIGAVVGKDAEATKLVEQMKDQFSEISANAYSEEDKTVYFEVSPLEYGLWTAGSNTYMDELSQMLGLKNIFADVDGWGEISQEQVLERNPDYIITIASYMGEGMKPEEEIAQRSGWDTIAAIENERILNVNADIISRPGPRLTEAAQVIFDFIYKE